MFTILVAPDSFKESLDTMRVAQSIEMGIKKILPSAKVIKMPISDGGEGLIKTLVSSVGGELVYQDVYDPLGEKTKGHFGILRDGSTAVVELAVASGLALVPKEKRDPLIATTFGTGQLMKKAIEMGMTKIIVGLGGSATNDGGAGMLQALGVRLLDDSGHEIGFGAQGLNDLKKIDTSKLNELLKNVELVAACDVDNPLCGVCGASNIYGPQKGATDDIIGYLDKSLEHFAKIIHEQLSIDISELSGAGAAGGTGAGLVAFCGAAIRPGTELLMEILDMEGIIAKGIDLVITGEGEINKQTAYGKAPIRLAKLAKKYDVPVLAIVGSIGDDAEIVYEHGIDAIMSIIPRPVTLSYAMKEAEKLLVDAAARAMRLINIGAKGGIE